MASSEATLSRSQEDKLTGQRVIVVLEKAHLETAKLKDNYVLLNCDDHKSFLAKNKKNINEMRPDITHQCLMTLLDSPLNKAGKMLIYIHTHNNVLIEVSPQLRIPRTFKRFCGLMVELLHKQKIRATDGSEVLLKVISNPVTKYLPPGGRKFGFSVNGRLVRFRDFVQNLAKGKGAKKTATQAAEAPVEQPENPKKHKLEAGASGFSTSSGGPDSKKPRFDREADSTVEQTTKTGALDVPITFVVGAVAHGDPATEIDYIEENLAISNYGLSASVCCSKICNEFEELWNII
eukprot:GDKI01040691.1.p1 GENE.GDKI01040691.1~~GDKI01040691.1.p1  ORF type:complete len:305 (+),score=85.83 GDKI01040691.1:40-915(+)